MSYDIEYKRAAYFLPPDTSMVAGPGADPESLNRYRDLFVFHQVGCNNISPRPKTWALLASGWQYVVIGEVCKLAGQTEAGTLKFTNGDTTPEKYLAAYRKLLKEAKPLSVEALREDLGIHGLELHLEKLLCAKAWQEKPGDYQVKRILTLAKNGWHKEDDWCGMLRFSRSLETVDDLKAFADCIGLARSYAGYGHILSYQNT